MKFLNSHQTSNQMNNESKIAWFISGLASGIILMQIIIMLFKL
jgi:hypothetical protein